jgi:Zinc carboxypeptidase
LSTSIPGPAARLLTGIAALLLALGALGSAPPRAAAASGCSTRPDPRVPTWSSVNHFELGTREATDEEISAYVGAVARSSRRVRAGVLGQSGLGRPLPYALVSDPGHLTSRALDRLRADLAYLRQGGPADGRSRRALARDPAVVWVMGSVHSDEPTGADADMRLLYELASDPACAGGRRLARLLVVIVPVQNPDGRAAGTRVSGLGFDLNRDWFARTQPELQGKLALMTRFPPVALADQHEQAGSGFFFPPYTDPIHHEVPDAALHAMDDVFGPALARAFTAAGRPFASGAPYDLFYMGYGDSSSTTLFGAAGMTFEQGSDLAYSERVSGHLLAADTLLDTAAAQAPALQRAWAAQWRSARAQGSRGLLAPNRVFVAGDRVSFPVPRTPVYAYALRADGHAADAARLARRLAAVGVEVYRLRRPLPTTLRPFASAASGRALLAAGTYLVPLDQGPKHWVEAMLDDDSFIPFPYFYDVSSWSEPLLMGIDGGALVSPLPAGLRAGRRDRARLARVGGSAPAAAPVPLVQAGAYSFPGDSQASLELAFALLGRGLTVRREPVPAQPGSPLPAGSLVVGGTDRATLAALAPAFDTPVSAVGAVDLAGLVTLRAPKVALLTPAGSGPGQPFFSERGAPSLSPAWASFMLTRRLGLTVTPVTDSDLAAGRLVGGGFTHLVVAEGADNPDGTGSSSATLSTAALAQVQAFVRAGGAYVGERGQGAAVAAAAGLTGARSSADPPALQVPGASIRIALDPSDPVAWGLGAQTFAFDNQDPLLIPGAASRVVGRFPTGSGFSASGYTEGATALQGTAAVLDDALGAGHTVLFSFDPNFRAYTDATERLFANALLYPRPGAGGRRAAATAAAAAAAARSSRSPVRPWLQRTPSPAVRDSVIRVRLADLGALRSAAAAGGLPRGAGITLDLDSATLRVPSSDAVAEPAGRPWVAALLSRLARAGVAPTLVVL